MYLEGLLLLIIVVLVFIAYKLIALEKAFDALATAKAEALYTTLNPLFSEQEIALQRTASQQWQKKVDLYFKLLEKTEKEEIQNHHDSRMGKSEFTASPKLKRLILEFSVAITGRNTTEARAEQMIEANISILNGKSISEASEKFYSDRDRIPWENLDLDADAWSLEPKIQEEFEKGFLDAASTGKVAGCTS